MQENNYIKIPKDFNNLNDLTELVNNYEVMCKLQSCLNNYQEQYFNSFLKTYDEVLSYIPEKDYDKYKIVTGDYILCEYIYDNKQCINFIPNNYNSLFSNINPFRSVKPIKIKLFKDAKQIKITNQINKNNELKYIVDTKNYLLYRVQLDLMDFYYDKYNRLNSIHKDSIQYKIDSENKILSVILIHHEYEKDSYTKHKKLTKNEYIYNFNTLNNTFLSYEETKQY